MEKCPSELHITTVVFIENHTKMISRSNSAIFTGQSGDDRFQSLKRICLKMIVSS